MSKTEKLIAKILAGRSVSYDEAEKILLHLGFDLNIESSHHSFRKKGYYKVISIKKRSQLLQYQIKLLQEALIKHGYKE